MHRLQCNFNDKSALENTLEIPGLVPSEKIWCGPSCLVPSNSEGAVYLQDSSSEYLHHSYPRIIRCTTKLDGHDLQVYKSSRKGDQSPRRKRMVIVIDEYLIGAS